MKVIKAMKIAKRNKKAKEKFDLKHRGYTDNQYNSFSSLGEEYRKQYLAIEDNYILTGKIESQL